MTDRNKKMAMFTMLSSALAVVAFFLPMFDFLGYDFNGLDLIDVMGDSGIFVTVALGCCGCSAVFGLISMANPKLLSACLVTSVVSLGAIVYGFVSEEMLEYAGIGFYLTVAMDIVAIAMSVGGMKKTTSSSSSAA